MAHEAGVIRLPRLRQHPPEQAGMDRQASRATTTAVLLFGSAAGSVASDRAIRAPLAARERSDTATRPIVPPDRPHHRPRSFAPQNWRWHSGQSALEVRFIRRIEHHRPTTGLRAVAVLRGMIREPSAGRL